MPPFNLPEDPFDASLFMVGGDSIIVTATPEAGEPFTFTAYFDNTFFDPSIKSMVLETTQPRLTCAHADVASLERAKAVLTVKGVDYDLSEVQPDGTGTAVLILEYR